MTFCLEQSNTVLRFPTTLSNHNPAIESLTLSLTLCGLTGQKTHQGGPGLGGSVHEEAHPCFPYFAQRATSADVSHRQ